MACRLACRARPSPAIFAAPKTAGAGLPARGLPRRIARAIFRAGLKVIRYFHRLTGNGARV